MNDSKCPERTEAVHETLWHFLMVRVGKLEYGIESATASKAQPEATQFVLNDSNRAGFIEEDD